MEGTHSGRTGEGLGAQGSSCIIFYSGCAVTCPVVGLGRPAGLLTQNETNSNWTGTGDSGSSSNFVRDSWAVLWKFPCVVPGTHDPPSAFPARCVSAEAKRFSISGCMKGWTFLLVSPGVN